jgi:integrase
MKKVEPNIFKSPSGTFKIRYTKKCRGERREWKKSDIPSLREARKLKESFVAQAIAWAEEKESGFGCWKAATDSYFKHGCEYKSPTTVETERDNIAKYTNEWNRLSLSKLTPKYVKSHLREALKGTKDVTRKSIVKHIRNVFAYLVNEGAIDLNPLLGFTPWSKKLKRRELCCLNRKEIVTLFTEAYKRDHPFKDIWHVAYGTGLRSGEAMGLQWSDINWDNGTAIIQRATIKCNRSRLGLPKGGKPRCIAIYPQLLQRLDALRHEEGADEKWVLPYLPEWRNQKAAYVLRSFLKELGLPEVRFHDLRASFITHMLESGNVGLSTVKALVGHERTETTDRYIRNSSVKIEGKTSSIELEGVIDNAPKGFDWQQVEDSVSFMDELSSI